MRIKRNISVCLLFVLTAGLLAVPALAHGCGRGGGHHSGRTAVQPAAIAGKASVAADDPVAAHPRRCRLLRL